MSEPEFADEYPTEETLATLAAWSIADPSGCLDFAVKCWHWPDGVSHELRPAEREIVHADEGDRFVRFATGGWSGNEDVIAALKSNIMVRALCWRLSARGGLHIFEYPKKP